ncbi:LysR family transcriptional regulator [Tautonia plasticadhaerens]|uniref:Hydrogen peroxide-inducible genes activator n=1 Tax=Tautonia plasticadhaerens TaxID=2527974 RepID=A0A518HDI7_9BACT|nr:LysR family transcriptional regulator [Tautonia plasticadhaerens]QDV38918.1 Hydrogen peroxide-inducible genes activator [Tautonia plasticadhaerens]
MELNQLRTFLKIAELGSFTRAAEEAGVSQPALSQQVARLEHELGRPVFDRSGRSVRLTEAGRLLLPRASRIVALADDTTRELLDDGRVGRVVVAAIPTIAPFLLPPVLRSYRIDHPGASVQVDEEVTEALLRRCQRGELDVGVLALPADAPPGLAVEPLFDEELVLALPVGHPLAGLDAVPLDAVRAEPFVLLGDGHCLSDQIRSFCQQRAVQPVATGRTGQLAMVQELVALGHGISFVPEMARRVDASPNRVYRHLLGDRPRRTVAACWNPDRYQTRLALAFLEALRSYRFDPIA